ncbi:hypothetical protein AJ80_03451 [Polytolypa hystricis UAMH7299]|uniref:Uncharacterized protein n=1 Tax=Polytolypa hystricis (strain UAMH7299) TaxID=1447883 RepID=A0A2B7Y9T0_POLH7|nr:hypothetical protein AJ80_03451 [Polytolypa hystricis UAMH7299]
MSSHQGTALHPTRASLARRHEPSFKKVVERIQDAVTRAHTTNKKYDKVAVLSLRWSNDDLNLSGIEAALLNAFRDAFNFPTESFLIPHNQATVAAQLMARLLQVINKVPGRREPFSPHL